MVLINRRRVVVGVDGSLASLRALRRGVAEARRHGADVHVVYVRPHLRPERYEAGFLVEVPDSNDWQDRQAEGLMAGWLADGLGGPPPDVPEHCGEH